MKKLIVVGVVIGVVVAGTLTPHAEVTPESFDKLFPESLVDVHGKEVKLDALSGKLVGIYFSAHWCPPCRSFTPSLVKFRDGNSRDFEVVLVSADRSAAEQMKYMNNAGMKWPAVSWGARSVQRLAKKFKVYGIPTLIILDEDGRVITRDGRGDVNGNPAGAIAKWKKASSAK